MTALRTSSSPAISRHLVSADEFERMVAAAVFHPESRLELIEGEIVSMSPIDKDHAYVVDDLNAHFASLMSQTRISIQGPLRLSDMSRPQPDVMLLKRHKHGYRKRLPVPSDVLLAIEVADSTFRLDFDVKRPLYAGEGIGELWVIQIPKKCIHVCRKPDGGIYRDEQIVSGRDKIAPLAFPDHLLTVRDLLG